MARPKGSKNKRNVVVEEHEDIHVDEPSIQEPEQKKEQADTFSGGVNIQPREDIMKPKSLKIGERVQVVGGMGLGLAKEVKTEQAPPLSRADLRAKGFIR